jgi:hypothetical protein
MSPLYGTSIAINTLRYGVFVFTLYSFIWSLSILFSKFFQKILNFMDIYNIIEVGGEFYDR